MKSLRAHSPVSCRQQGFLSASLLHTLPPRSDCLLYPVLFLLRKNCKRDSTVFRTECELVLTGCVQDRVWGLHLQSVFRTECGAYRVEAVSSLMS